MNIKQVMNFKIDVKKKFNNIVVEAVNTNIFMEIELRIYRDDDFRFIVINTKNNKKHYYINTVPKKYELLYNSMNALGILSDGNNKYINEPIMSVDWGSGISHTSWHSHNFGTSQLITNLKFDSKRGAFHQVYHEYEQSYDIFEELSSKMKSKFFKDLPKDNCMDFIMNRDMYIFNKLKIYKYIRENSMEKFFISDF